MELPTFRQQHALGAALAERFGWLVPMDYGDPIAEARAVRERAGLADRSDRGKVRLAGPDRVAFLQALVTNDVSAVAPGRGIYALGLNHKGQIAAEFPILPWGETLLLAVEPEERAFVIGWLRRFKLRRKVEIADVTESIGLLSLVGPAAPAILAAWLGEPLILERDAVAEREWRGAPLLLAGNRDLGEIGYDLYLPSDKTAEAWEALRAAGNPRPFGRTAWEALRIEAGTPRYGPELNESTLPPEAQLETRAISYTKGCYPGQEIVARIKNRGHVNRFLRGLQFDPGPVPAPGAALWAGDRHVGAVTSAALSPTLGLPIALAYLRREVVPGERVRLDDGREATVVELPFRAVAEAVR
ncbi:MAG: aminomethyltransferase family protein [Chloroflexota bacterium]|nr:aminomethyltransferase family protein [Dehalococcoidia bacterium]MDW8253840.1 aminomethyltransferase family protein [Chloroflexota bacterium]